MVRRLMRVKATSIYLWLLSILGVIEKSYAQLDSTQQLRAVTVKGINIPITDVRTIVPSQTVKVQDFKKTSSYNVADAIRNFSGVNIKDYGGIGGLKTVSVRSLGANHTAVQVDGVPVTDTQNGQIDLGKINLDLVESITLANGQPSDIGLPARSFSSASVLLIKSAIPKVDSLDPLKVKTSFTTGSFGLWHPSIQVQYYLGNSWRLRATTGYQKAHGRYSFKVHGDGSDSSITRTNADVRVLQQDIAVYWQRNEHTRLQIRANYFHSDRGLPGAVVFYNPYTSQHLWNRDSFLQTSFEHQKGRWKWLVNSKYSYLYTRYLDPDYLNSIGKLDQRYKQHEGYASSTLVWHPSKHLTMAYAADWSLSSLETNSYGFVYPIRNTILQSVTAQLKFKKIEGQATLLHTQLIESVKQGESTGNKSVLSPTLLLSYTPFSKGDLVLRAFYKDIFRAPTFSDLYYTRVGNRNLKPEWAKQYNVGATWQKTGVGRFDYIQGTVDAYYNYVKDKIVAVPNKDLFSWTMLNLGEVDIRGVDVTFKTLARISNRLNATLTTNYTFQEALDVTNRSSSYYLHQIPYTPRHSFALNAGLEMTQWSVHINQTYSSHRYYLSENLPEYYVPGFFITDLSCQYRLPFKEKTATISLQSTNVFNTAYAFIRSFPMPGRAYRLAIQFSI